MSRFAPVVAPLFALLITGCPQEIVAVDLDFGPRRAMDTGIATGSDAAPTDTSAVDVGMSDAGPVDGTTTDATAVDAGQSACWVDPFDLCADPNEATNTNDEVHDPDYFTGGGCLQDDDLVITQDFNIDAVLCPTEPADFYSANHVGCTNRLVRVVATLTLTEPCDPADFEFKAYRSRVELACGVDVECIDNGNELIIRQTLEQRPEILDRRFGVIRTNDSVRVPYHLRVQVF